MRNFTFHGASTNLGQYGLVKKGETVQMSEADAYSVRGNPEFKPNPERKPPGFPDIGTPPASAKYFHLNSLPWRNEKVFQAVRKLRRSALQKALLELGHLGFPEIPEDLGRIDTEAMREHLLTMGRLAGWV